MVQLMPIIWLSDAQAIQGNRQMLLKETEIRICGKNWNLEPQGNSADEEVGI